MATEILSMAFKYFDRVPLGLTIPGEIVSIEFKSFDFVSLLNVKLLYFIYLFIYLFVDSPKAGV